MAQHFDNDFIENVRESTDIINVVSQYLTIKKAGTNYKAPCPFHNEKTPSFVVSPHKQIFKCFGCQKAGNVFHFVMEIEGVSFPESVEMLAKEANILLPEKQGNYNREKNVGIMDALNWANIFFQRCLADFSGKKAREYLLSRGLTKKNIDTFSVGFAPKGWDNFLKEAIKEGFKEKVLLEAGLIIPKENGYYDRFRNRVMFPICNARGKVIAFGGRVIDDNDQPKYLNSPETPIFQKKKTLYAFHLARESVSKTKQITIMEGYTDVLMAYQKGYKGVVATLGTALSVEHVDFIKRYSECAILVFDGDTAGIHAASRSISHFLARNLNVKIAIPPYKLDPFEFMREYGLESFQEIINKAQDFFEFELEQLKNQHDITNIQGKRNIIKCLAQKIAIIPDEITKRLFAKKMSDVFEISLNNILHELGFKKKQAVVPVASIPNTQSHANTLILAEQNFVIASVMQHNDLGKKVFEFYQPQDFFNPKVAKIATVLCDYIKNDKTINLSSMSAILEPEVGQELVSIYYSENLEDKEKVAERLKLTIKGHLRQKKRAEINKLRQALMATSTNDQEKRTQILLDAQEVCKARLRDIE